MQVDHFGGCHCGRVTFKVEDHDEIVAYECNCSICKMVGFLHLQVEKVNFHILTGRDNLTEYTFNTGIAKHYFCKTCGVKSFYIPRSKPNGYSINVRCLKPDTIKAVTRIPFDGQNWEQSMDDMRGMM